MKEKRNTARKLSTRSECKTVRNEQSTHSTETLLLVKIALEDRSDIVRIAKPKVGMSVDSDVTRPMF